METKDMIDKEKKVYNPPKLVEYGDLMEMTQGCPSGNPEAGGLGSRDVQIIQP